MIYLQVCLPPPPSHFCIMEPQINSTGNVSLYSGKLHSFAPNVHHVSRRIKNEKLYQHAKIERNEQLLHCHVVPQNTTRTNTS